MQQQAIATAMPRPIGRWGLVASEPLAAAFSPLQARCDLGKQLLQLCKGFGHGIRSACRSFPRSGYRQSERPNSFPLRRGSAPYRGHGEQSASRALGLKGAHTGLPIREIPPRPLAR